MIKIFFSADNILSDKKLNLFAFKFASRFLKNVYNKFILDQSQFRFTSTNSLNLLSVFEVREKQNNILKAINFLSTFFVDSNQDKSRYKNVIFLLIEISVEKIIYDCFIDS